MVKPIEVSLSSELRQFNSQTRWQRCLCPSRMQTTKFQVAWECALREFLLFSRFKRKCQDRATLSLHFPGQVSLTSRMSTLSSKLSRLVNSAMPISLQGSNLRFRIATCNTCSMRHSQLLTNWSLETLDSMLEMDAQSYWTTYRCTLDLPWSTIFALDGPFQWSPPSTIQPLTESQAIQDHCTSRVVTISMRPLSLMLALL